MELRGFVPLSQIRAWDISLHSDSSVSTVRGDDSDIQTKNCNISNLSPNDIASKMQSGLNLAHPNHEAYMRS